MQPKRRRICLDYPFPEERVFRYQAMQDILHHLVNNPFEGFTQKELATIIGADVSSISRSVDLLDRLGVLSISGENPARISLDEDHIEGTDPFFAIPQHEFRAPTRAYLDQLEAAIEASDHVAELAGVILFGSVARGTADRSSDIDLLVIVAGDGTYGRRIGSRLARTLEEQSFQGDRYQFEVLVETPASAASHSDRIRGIFEEGIVLQRTDALASVREAVFENEGEAE
jgi:predicted nucleotidyltransferase